MDYQYPAERRLSHARFHLIIFSFFSTRRIDGSGFKKTFKHNLVQYFFQVPQNRKKARRFHRKDEEISLAKTKRLMLDGFGNQAFFLY
ncbi:hypothetical protein Aconfl_07250 [Algoriphagus confluentis]|uniref:Uncharacterized protein n=1 Tax=Algoriphagus confluentis TaxID=1697556 RepID=A0ABQ6PJE4_9BACT|nr:hypothetical protein Aconfl_07250 [Algoriphagus confluentis]